MKLHFKTLIISTILVIGTAFTIYQCEKPVEKSKEKSITALVVSVGSTDYSATISQTNITFADKVPSGTTEVSIKTITISEKANASKSAGDKLNVGTSNSITVTAEDGTTANYTVTINAANPVIPPVETRKPSVSTDNATNITVSGSTISGTIIDIGTSSVTSHGHVWSTGNNPTITGNGVIKNDLGNVTTSGVTFSTSINGLSENTTYFVRAFATNSVGTGYGVIKNFKTLQNGSLGTISGSSQVNITISGSGTNTTVIVSSTVSSLGSGSITQHGHVYSTTLQNNNLIIGAENAFYSELGTKNTIGDFTSEIENLNAFSTYYIRPYIITNGNVIYGQQSSFMTPEGAPTVSLGNVKSTLNQISISGNITNLGGEASTISQYGHIWSSTSGNLTTALSTKTEFGSSSQTTSFGTVVTGLSENSTIYFSAYATNSFGTAYSKVQSYKTLNDEADILSLTIKAGAYILARSVTGPTISFSGLPYGTTQVTFSSVTLSDQASATIGSNSFTSGSMINVGSHTITVSASNGITKEYTLSLSNTPATAPTVKSLTPESIDLTPTTAILRGKFTSYGVSPLSGYGFRYYVSSNPGNPITVYSNNRVSSNFSSEITGLNPNTMYSVSAFARNDAGENTNTNLIEFTTKSYTVPSVNTLAAVSIEQNNATINGEITNLGYHNSINGNGFIYSSDINAAFTITGTGTVITLNNKNDLGNFSYKLTGLSANTTYYVVVYATNDSGTAYSIKNNFTTKNSLPKVNTTSVSNISGTGIVFKGNLTSLEGYIQVTQHGFIYGTVKEDALVISGTGVTAVPLGVKNNLGFFEHTLSTLTGDDTHYVKAYASNGEGTSYGVQRSFIPNSDASNQTIEISTAEQLQAIKDSLNAKYIQTADIDLSSISNFIPIGSNSNRFTGTYNGNGFKITNLTINSTQNDVGMFGAVNGTLENMHLEDVKITANSFVGGLVGANHGTIRNITIKNIEIFGASGDDKGGLVGYNNSSIRNVSVENIRISGGNKIGGIVGENRGPISNSYVAGGSIIINNNNGGGIVGENYNYITNSYSTINIYQASGSVGLGGVISWNRSYASNVSNCYSVSSIKSNDFAGGLAGNNNGTINNVYSLGRVIEGAKGAIGTASASSTNTSIYWNTETSNSNTSDKGTSRTSTQMVNGNSNFSGFGSQWSFPASSYPVLANHISPYDRQAVHQALGLLQLSNNDTSEFFGGSNVQNEINASANAVSSSGLTLFVLDVNAGASNDSSRVDFWDCTAGTGNTILTTSSVNGTSVTLRFAAGTTSTNAWSKASGTSCNVVRSSSGSNPVSGDSLNLEAVISKGNESFTEKFNITFN